MKKVLLGLMFLTNGLFAENIGTVHTKDTGGENASHSISVVPITNFYGQYEIKDNKYDSLRKVYGK